MRRRLQSQQQAQTEARQPRRHLERLTGRIPPLSGDIEDQQRRGVHPALVISDQGLPERRHRGGVGQLKDRDGLGFTIMQDPPFRLRQRQELAAHPHVSATLRVVLAACPLSCPKPPLPFSPAAPVPRLMPTLLAL